MVLKDGKGKWVPQWLYEIKYAGHFEVYLIGIDERGPAVIRLEYTDADMTFYETRLRRASRRFWWAYGMALRHTRDLVPGGAKLELKDIMSPDTPDILLGMVPMDWEKRKNKAYLKEWRKLAADLFEGRGTSKKRRSTV